LDIKKVEGLTSKRVSQKVEEVFKSL